MKEPTHAVDHRPCRTRGPKGQNLVPLDGVDDTGRIWFHALVAAPTDGVGLVAHDVCAESVTQDSCRILGHTVGAPRLELGTPGPLGPVAEYVGAQSGFVEPFCSPTPLALAAPFLDVWGLFGDSSDTALKKDLSSSPTDTRSQTAHASGVASAISTRTAVFRQISVTVCSSDHCRARSTTAHRVTSRRDRHQGLQHTRRLGRGTASTPGIEPDIEPIGRPGRITARPGVASPGGTAALPHCWRSGLKQMGSYVDVRSTSDRAVFVPLRPRPLQLGSPRRSCASAAAGARRARICRVGSKPRHRGDLGHRDGTQS